MEQPAGLVERMTMAGRIYEAVMARKNRKAGEWAKWKRENVEHVAVLEWIDELRAKALAPL